MCLFNVFSMGGAIKNSVGGFNDFSSNCQVLNGQSNGYYPSTSHCDMGNQFQTNFNGYNQNSFPSYSNQDTSYSFNQQNFPNNFQTNCGSGYPTYDGGNYNCVPFNNNAYDSYNTQQYTNQNYDGSYHPQVSYQNYDGGYQHQFSNQIDNHQVSNLPNYPMSVFNPSNQISDSFSSQTSSSFQQHQFSQIDHSSVSVFAPSYQNVCPSSNTISSNMSSNMTSLDMSSHTTSVTSNTGCPQHGNFGFNDTMHTFI